ncbi:hypothetical protein Dimus_017428 [Dionaea muscipula]
MPTTMSPSVKSAPIDVGTLAIIWCQVRRCTMPEEHSLNTDYGPVECWVHSRLLLGGISFCAGCTLVGNDDNIASGAKCPVTFAGCRMRSHPMPDTLSLGVEAALVRWWLQSHPVQIWHVSETTCDLTYTRESERDVPLSGARSLGAVCALALSQVRSSPVLGAHSLDAEAPKKSCTPSPKKLAAATCYVKASKPVADVGNACGHQLRADQCGKLLQDAASSPAAGIDAAQGLIFGAEAPKKSCTPSTKKLAAATCYVKASRPVADVGSACGHQLRADRCGKLLQEAANSPAASIDAAYV